MKRIIPFMLMAVLALTTMQCNQPSSGLEITGKITNAQNLQVFLDKFVYGKASEVVARQIVDNEGKFSFNFPEGLNEGVYLLRIGARRAALVLNGTENTVELNGDLPLLDRYQFTVNGSPSSETFRAFLDNAMNGNSPTLEEVQQFVASTPDPHVAAFTAHFLGSSNPQYLALQQQGQARLAQAYPQSEMTTAFAAYLSAYQAQVETQKRGGPIRVGDLAPDIVMDGPKGQSYALSQLKGKVVLLDFWASWCAPCRRENPNVVEVYNKYKDQGFTVFSVSLDRTKDAWLRAIEQDKLSWPTHVSDLQYWNSAAAKLYGVRGIPATFLIDREGNIAATGLRGATQIEAALIQQL